ASGIAVGVAVIVALLSFTQGLRETAAGFVHLGGSALGVFQSGVSDPSASILPEAAAGRLRSVSGVAQATPLLLIVEGIHSESSAVAFGADPGGFFSRSLVVVEGSRPAAGATAVMVGDRLAGRLHVHPGGALTISGRRFP